MKTKTEQELSELLMKSRETLRTERFSAAGARAKDPNGQQKLRKEIARVLTEQRARAIKPA
jgi:ribosomal protein L29